MFGSRPKHKKKEEENQKKKWQEDYEQEDDVVDVANEDQGDSDPEPAQQEKAAQNEEERRFTRWNPEDPWELESELEREKEEEAKQEKFEWLGSDSDVEGMTGSHEVWANRVRCYLEKDEEEGKKPVEENNKAVSRDDRTIYIDGLPGDLTEDDLRSLFSKYGAIQ